MTSPELEDPPVPRIEPVIEPSGPESPPAADPPANRRPGLRGLVAVAVLAAVVSGAVAAGVTTVLYRQQARTNPQDLNLGSNVTISEENAALQVANKALPAVVSVVTEDRGTSFGSGFVVTSDGYIVTSTIVLANASSLSVVMIGDAKRHDARLIDYDCRSGAAVIKVDQVTGLPTLPFGDAAALRPGQTVIALGGPLEQHSEVTRGLVTALHKRAVITGPVSASTSSVFSDTIQTDAAISTGSSGGPLLNVGGQVVGLGVAANSGGGAVAFALSSNALQPGVQQILQSGRLLVPGMGVETTDLSTEDAALRGLSVGSLVNGLTRGGPAEQSGLKVGDVITQLDATRLDAAHPLNQMLQTDFRPSQRIQVSYVRSGSSSQVQLTLQGEHPVCG